MSSVAVDVFAEDRAHEEFIKALIQRLAREEGVSVDVHIRAARGGHPRAIAELDLYQRSVTAGVAGLIQPDLLVVVIDANCRRYAAARNSIVEAVHRTFRGRTAVACPDPHVERWYLADPISFTRAIGKQPKLGKRKCDRERYKNILSEAVRAAGHPVLLGGIEFAKEIVDAMDLYRAGKSEKSLKHFLDAVVPLLKRHAA